MAGTSERMATTTSSEGKGKEIMLDEDSTPQVLGRRRHRESDDIPTQPTCTCRKEDTRDNLIHTAFETLVVSLRDRFQRREPRVFEACYNILHQFTFQEMPGREAFDRLTCILVNERNILKEATEMFALYMSVGECLTRHRDIEPIDLLTLHKILDFYGL